MRSYDTLTGILARNDGAINSLSYADGEFEFLCTPPHYFIHTIIANAFIGNEESPYVAIMLITKDELPDRFLVRLNGLAVTLEPEQYQAIVDKVSEFYSKAKSDLAQIKADAEAEKRLAVKSRNERPALSTLEAENLAKKIEGKAAPKQKKKVDFSKELTKTKELVEEAGEVRLCIKKFEGYVSGLESRSQISSVSAATIEKNFKPVRDKYNAYFAKANQHYKMMEKIIQKSNDSALEKSSSVLSERLSEIKAEKSAIEEKFAAVTALIKESKHQKKNVVEPDLALAAPSILGAASASGMWYRRNPYSCTEGEHIITIKQNECKVTIKL
jgi:hypothetical protein